MERTYNCATTLAEQATGPLQNHLDAFVASLIEKDYAASVVYHGVRRIVDFDRWLAQAGHVAGSIDEALVESYRRDRMSLPGRHTEWINELRALRRLLRHLRAQGVCPYITSNERPVDHLLAAFEHHLTDLKGLASGTVNYYCSYAEAFLVERFGDGEVDLGSIDASHVIDFVRRRAKTLKPAALKQVGTSLRALLRYAQYRGDVRPELLSAVPAIASWKATPVLPRAIAADHARRAIEACDPRTVVGCRDRAVLLMLARLGLRGCEVARLSLDDIDWGAGTLLVHGKGGQRVRMPLPDDVGAAIAHYLSNARPACNDRHVFLRVRAPIRALREESDAVGSIVAHAMRRARVQAPHFGSHQFRHALAVRLLSDGASLREIGDVLRHRSPQATSLYARVDIVALRGLATAWPGDAR